jgi:hypothetical protein
MTSDMQDILTLCVDRYLEGRWSRADCLRRFPDHATVITDLLDLCDQLREWAPAPMSRQQLAAGEHEMVAELDRFVEAGRGRFSPGRLLAGLGSAAIKSRIAVAASALMALILVGGSVSLAATFSGPEGVLYDYKLALEQVQVRLAPEAEKPALYMELAERRLDELEDLGEDASQELSAKVAGHYDDFVNDGLTTLQVMSSPDTGAPDADFADSRKDYVERLGEHRERLETFVAAEPAGGGSAHDLLALNDSSLESVPTLPPEPVVEAAATATPVADPPATPPESESGPVLATPETEDSELLLTPTPSPTPDIRTMPPMEFSGTVTALGTTALMVDGRRVIADTALGPGLTVVGLPVVGSKVAVAGFERADGVVVATSIRVEVADATATLTATATLIPTETPTATEMPTVTATPSPTDTPATDAEGAVFTTTGTVTELADETMVVGELTIRLVPEDGEAPTLIEGGEIAVGATVRVVGQVLAGNVLVATTVVVEIPAPPLDEKPEDDATPTPTPAADDETPTPTPPPAADDETPTPNPDEATPTPAPNDGTPTPTPTPDQGTPTPTPTPAEDATPTPTALPTNVIVVGLVEAVDAESVQIDGQVFQIVAGEGGTVLLVSLAIGDLVTVEARRLDDGTLVATVIGAAPTPTPPTPTPPTPDPTITPVVEGTPEDAAAATG